MCCDVLTANGFHPASVRANPQADFNLKFVVLLVTVRCTTATWTQVCHKSAKYKVQQVTCDSQRSPSQIGALPHSTHVVATKVKMNIIHDGMCTCVAGNNDLWLNLALVRSLHACVRDN